MVELPTQRRQPPRRVCERMIRLVADVLNNCRNGQLRDELETLQDNLAPAARELDKWVLAYRSYGTQPGHDTAGLAGLHNEILEGDEEIAAYLLRTVQSYITWCKEQLDICIKGRPDLARSLQEGFVREDLRKLSKTLGELEDVWAANVRNKKWMDLHQVSKRKYAEPVTDDTQPQLKRVRTSDYSMRRHVDIIDLEASDEPTPVTSQAEHHTPNPRRRKRSKKDRVLPADPDLASHVATSILRAVGRHPDAPPLNEGLEGLLPRRLRKAEIPDGMTMATVQDAMVRGAQDWWNAKG